MPGLQTLARGVTGARSLIQVLQVASDLLTTIAHRQTLSMRLWRNAGLGTVRAWSGFTTAAELSQEDAALGAGALEITAQRPKAKP